MNLKQNLLKNENGFASLVIALILILILSLLTVGFAQFTRREQQNSLDKQLAIQANYAAETGINDAIRDINTICDPSTGQHCINSANANSSSCMKSLPPGAATAKNIIDAANGVSYSCVLVSLTVPNLKYGNVGPGQSVSASFTTNASLSNLTVQWSSHDGHNGTLNGNSFLPYGNWNSAKYSAVIQFSITPIINSDFSRSALMSNSRTFYLYPSNSTGNISYTAVNGSIANSKNCGTNSHCVTINSLPAASSYVIHYLVQYDPTDILITGNGSSATFTGAQAMVDVTGKAQNVLKRLQVRVSYASGTTAGSATSSLPDYAIEAQNVCSRQKLYGNSQNSNFFVDAPGSSSNPDPCNLVN